MNRRVALIAVFSVCAITLAFVAWKRFETRSRPDERVPRSEDLPVKSKTDDISSTRLQGIEPALEPKDNGLIGGSGPSKDDASKRAEDRTAGIKIGVNGFWGRPIEGLELSADEEEKLKKFLVAKGEAAWIAHDVAKEANSGNPGDFGEAVDASQREVDLEMEKAFDPQTFQKIRAMLDAKSYIGLISHSYDGHFVDAGVPLSPKQYLSLALAMSAAYSRQDSTENLPLVTTIDPGTGLSPADYQVINRASDAMNAQQISVLKNAMIELNKGRLRQN